MSENLSQNLADFQGKGYVIAPAGYGKTYLIAEAVKKASSRQLVLTHTYAGVNSIRTKMIHQRVDSSKYQLDTIASWCLRLCLSYPETSGWRIENPTGVEWRQLYEPCEVLLRQKFIQYVVTSSYSGIYVDEYQDCSEVQNSLISALAEFLPCIVLGDPLQALFDFADKPVDWESSIFPYFKNLGTLDIPWRWRNAGSPDLGSWLDEARRLLQNDQQIDLSGKLPDGVKKMLVNLDDFTDRKRLSIFYSFLGKNDSVIAIHSGHQRFKNKTHKLAQGLQGKFSSIEEVECKTLASFCVKFQLEMSTKRKFLQALEFSKKCFTGVSGVLSAGTKRGETAKKSKTTKYPNLLDSANRFLEEPTSENLMKFFLDLKANKKIGIFRRDLFYRFLAVLGMHIENNALSLVESFDAYQKIFRHSGRPVQHKKQIGTTLLVKGLEFDHAIILDVGSLGRKELYVALTRGAKSLTILSGGAETVFPIL